MRTRPDAQQEALTRRLALLHATPPADERAIPTDGWWSAHTVIPDWADPDEDEPRDDEPEERDVAPVSLVPTPGRHASRRALAPPPSVLPEALRGRIRLGPAQLAVVALVVAAALALACWWLARGRATALTPVAAVSASPLVALDAPAATGPPATGGAGPVVAPSAPSMGASSGAMVTVDVEGKVRHPGIAILPVGSRVTDALEAAGGLPHRRALGGLNLAAVLVDGQQIMVGGPPAGATSTGTSTSGGVATTGGGGLVDLNTATADELDTLPGVGPVTAQSILEWREQNGGFTSVQELLEVNGIGPATLAKLAPHVTV